MRPALSIHSKGNRGGPCPRGPYRDEQVHKEINARVPIVMPAMRRKNQELVFVGLAVCSGQCALGGLRGGDGQDVQGMKA